MDIGLILLLASCQAPKVTSPGKSNFRVGDPKMLNFSMASYEGDEMSYVLNARQADILRKEDRVFITNPKLKIYKKGAKGQLLVVASGKKGHFMMGSKDLTLEEDVDYRVVSKNLKLTTSKLIYWAERHETEVPVGTGYLLETQDGKVEGSGMISKEDLTKNE